MLRVTALLLIGLVCQMLVASAAPCCCVRAAAEAASSSRHAARPTRHCCGSDESTPRGATGTRKKPTSHRDCSCKPGAATPADRTQAVEIGVLELATPTFVLLPSVRAPELAVGATLPVRDTGPPGAPSSASPSLLPVLRL